MMNREALMTMLAIGLPYALRLRAQPADKLVRIGLLGSLGLQLERIEVSSPGELDAAIARAAGGSLVALGDPMVIAHRWRIIELTLCHRVPSVFGQFEFVINLKAARTLGPTLLKALLQCMGEEDDAETRNSPPPQRTAPDARSRRAHRAPSRGRRPGSRRGGA